MWFCSVESSTNGGQLTAQVVVCQDEDNIEGDGVHDEDANRNPAPPVMVREAELCEQPVAQVLVFARVRLQQHLLSASPIQLATRSCLTESDAKMYHHPLSMLGSISCILTMLPLLSKVSFHLILPAGGGELVDEQSTLCVLHGRRPVGPHHPRVHVLCKVQQCNSPLVDKSHNTAGRLLRHVCLMFREGTLYQRAALQRSYDFFMLHA